MRKLVNLRELRERAALSQGELASEAGISKNAVGQLERGEFNPRPATVRRLAEALGVRPDKLWESTDPKAAAAPLSPVVSEEDADEERRMQEAEELEERRTRDFFQRFPHEEERREYVEGHVLRINAHYSKLFRTILAILKERDTDVNGLGTMFDFFNSNGLQRALEESGVIAYMNSVIQGKAEASLKEREFCTEIAKKISEELRVKSEIAEDARNLARRQHSAGDEVEQMMPDLEAYLPAANTDSGGRHSEAPTERQ